MPDMRWMWIDRILELDPGRRLVAVKAVSLAEEHLHDHFPAAPGASGRPPRPPTPIMPASLVIEGMAQSAGILVGHAGGLRENVILAKVGRAELILDAVPGDTIRYTATVDQMDRQGAATSGLVELLAPGRAPAEMGRIDLMFSFLDGRMALDGGQRLPEHNFVFTDAFRTLLHNSGIDAGLKTP
jgi:3-hydroxyacyl-[acyl-carrier-protein] dehydratase